ncbi:TIGR02281 family clan AA aspartic protease [Brevundimonas sp.]|uniref:TIGR02281 family clan AA aspartic protease n=1 Tax=Brevundimonas sp. TaxID=1871086 RepID=UPI002614D2CD|nr:TIGR02281 family clan AA aspartic protease [Brevundimonas sp.]
MRFDIQSMIVMAIATVSSLSVAWWLTHQEPRAAQAAEVPAVMVVPTEAPVAVRAAPGQPAQIARAADGHYWAEADIDGRAIRVLVDTGASVVALTRQDALRLGLRLTPADFTQTIETASGPAKAAAVELDHVAVAGARVDKVRALVVEEGLPHSLLGMSYLGRLSSFEARPTGLTLRP